MQLVFLFICSLIENCFKAAYCSICEIFVVASTGLVCDSCGVCSHPHCTKKADSHLKCKDKYLKNGKSISHHWVKGIHYLLGLGFG